MTGTLTIVELISIIFALVAEGFAVRGFYKWRREDQQRRRDGLNGPLEIFYRGKIRLYTIGMVAFFLCLILDVAAVLVPSPPAATTPGLQTNIAKALFVEGPFVIIAVVVLFALTLVFDNRDRTLTDRAHDKKAEQRLLSIEAAARTAALRADTTDKKAGVAFTRADVAERRADAAADTAGVALRRADVAERRADAAAVKVEGLTPRVDSAEGELNVHTGEITDHTGRIDTLEKHDG